MVMLTDLADVLRGAGLPVYEESGWKTRAVSGNFDPRAIMLHHDASPAGQTSNGSDVIVNGRPGLTGPLSQLWLAYDGTWHICAAGRANHAGDGQAWGVVRAGYGNTDCVGIETDHTTGEKWTADQRSSGGVGVAALMSHYGWAPENALTSHKEYAPDRKVDPDPLNMDDARAAVRTIMDGEVEFMPSVEEIADEVWSRFKVYGVDGKATLTFGDAMSTIFQAAQDARSDALAIKVCDEVWKRYKVRDDAGNLVPLLDAQQAILRAVT
jgi:hypothetical protein